MSQVENEIGYDRLAWFYNRYWGTRYHRQALPIVERLLLSRISPGAPLLDLCCGTGHLTRALAERGCRVTGIDASEAMLRFARENVPAADFMLGDARDFNFPARFEAAICTFDSLNHVTETRELAAVFQNVHRALSEGGLFLFDLNLEEAYLNEWGKSSAIVEEDHVCIVRGGYDAGKRLGRTEITLFRREEEWRRWDVTLFQRCHLPEEIHAALRESGFEKVRCYDARRELGMTGEIGVGRAYFLAEKRKGFGDSPRPSMDLNEKGAFEDVSG